jgi:hypothetical protein
MWFTTDTMERHMMHTPLRVASAEDSARAREIGRTVFSAIEKFRDPDVAIASGYMKFPPGDNQPLYHFGNPKLSALEMDRFDAEKPSSLLYKPDGKGGLRLIGAMFLAPDTASLATLNAWTPLGIARWHRHVAQCFPKSSELGRLNEVQNGHPVFGTNSLIASKAECDAVGGEFQDAVGPWMLHVYVFEGEDLATIWSIDNGMGNHLSTHATHRP